MSKNSQLNKDTKNLQQTNEKDQEEMQTNTEQTENQKAKDDYHLQENISSQTEIKTEPKTILPDLEVQKDKENEKQENDKKKVKTTTKTSLFLPKLKTLDFLLITVCLLLVSLLLLSLLAFGFYEQNNQIHLLKQQLILEKNAVSSLSQENTNLKQQIASLEQQNQNKKTSNKTFTLEKPNFNKDHWLGPQEAKIVWLVYSDYQCPFCKKIHPDLLKLQSNNSDLALAFRHLPLVSLHPFALDLAEASECVSSESRDKFWEFTNLVFSQDQVTKENLPSLIAKLGLDTKKIQDCLNSQKFRQEILEKTNEHLEAGFKSTPLSIVFNLQTNNARVVPGALDYSALQQIVQEMRETKAN